MGETYELPGITLDFSEFVTGIDADRKKLEEINRKMDEIDKYVRMSISKTPPVKDLISAARLALLVFRAQKKSPDMPKTLCVDNYTEDCLISALRHLGEELS